MDLTGLLGFNVLVGIGTLALITVGLGVIYGMMKIINLAHGEFMMLGAYATYVATAHGINIWIAMLVISPVFVGLVGLWPYDRHHARNLGPQPRVDRSHDQHLRQ
jgi:urea transport system permease protein